MSAKRKIDGQNWEFDGQTITVRIPMTFVRRGGRKVIIAPDGRDAWVPARPRPDEALIRALSVAARTAGSGCWTTEGTAPPASWPKRRASPAASSTGCYGSHCWRPIFRRGHFLEGRQPKTMQLERFTDNMARNGRGSGRLFCQAPP